MAAKETTKVLKIKGSRKDGHSVRGSLATYVVCALASVVSAENLNVWQSMAIGLKERSQITTFGERHPDGDGRRSKYHMREREQRLGYLQFLFLCASGGQCCDLEICDHDAYTDF